MIASISFGGTYSGGNGSAGNPYLISTAADLIELSNTENDWDSGYYFLQTSDIIFNDDEALVDWDGDGTVGDNGDSEGFTPIGRKDGEKFKGNYNGQNFSISNIYINSDAGKTEFGLFGYIEDSTIENLTVLNIEITTTKKKVGGLVGNAKNSTITNCHVTGSLTGDNEVGGLVGKLEKSDISGSSANTTIVGHDKVGGLVGEAKDDSEITNSSAITSIDAHNSVGGLVGKIDKVIISDVSASGTVDANDKSGGLIGEVKDDDTEIDNATADVDVSGNNDVGGLIGKISDDGTVTDSTSLGDVSGTGDDVGGFVGDSNGGVTYTDNQYSGSLPAAGDGSTFEPEEVINNPYSLTYTINSGESGSVPVDSTTYGVGDTVTLSGSGNLALTGYEFGGWVDLDPNPAIIVDNVLTMPARDVTVAAVWNKLSTVTYVVDASDTGVSGTPPVDVTVYASGNTVTLANAGTLTRTGYEFGGWLDLDGSPVTITNSTFIMPGRDVTLTAQWNKLSTITYVVDVADTDVTGTVPVDGNTYAAGNSVVLATPDNLSKPDYTFGGWADLSASPAMIDDNVLTMPDRDVTLTAQWIKLSNVTYVVDSNDADVVGTVPIDTADYATGEVVSVATANLLSRPGYAFSGWLDLDSTPVTITNGSFTMPNRDVTLTAQWVQANVNYVVDSSDSGTVGIPPVDSTIYNTGDTVTVADSGSLARAGYIFTEWVDLSATPVTITNGEFTMPNRVVTLTATWQKADLISKTSVRKDNPGSDDIVYTHTIDVDGSTLYSSQLTKNQTDVATDFIFMFDVSGSMGDDIEPGLSKLDSLKIAAKDFVDIVITANPNNRVAIIDFEGTSSLVQAFTSNQTTLDNSIDSLADGGWTNVAEALDRATALIENRVDKSREVFSVLLGDGAVSGYSVSQPRNYQITGYEIVSDANGFHLEAVTFDSTTTPNPNTETAVLGPNNLTLDLYFADETPDTSDFATEAELRAANVDGFWGNEADLFTYYLSKLLNSNSNINIAYDLDTSVGDFYQKMATDPADAGIQTFYNPNTSAGLIGAFDTIANDILIVAGTNAVLTDQLPVYMEMVIPTDAEAYAYDDVTLIHSWVDSEGRNVTFDESTRIITWQIDVINATVDNFVYDTILIPENIDTDLYYVDDKLEFPLNGETKINFDDYEGVAQNDSAVIDDDNFTVTMDVEVAIITVEDYNNYFALNPAANSSDLYAQFATGSTVDLAANKQFYYAYKVNNTSDVEVTAQLTSSMGDLLASNITVGANDTEYVISLNPLSHSNSPNHGNTVTIEFAGSELDQSTVSGDLLYNVVYNGNNVSVANVPVDGNSYKVGETPTILDAGAMSNSGFTFVGWNTASDGSGIEAVVGTSVLAMPSGSDLQLYAQWNAIPTTADSTINILENVAYSFIGSEASYSDAENDDLDHVTITGLGSGSHGILFIDNDGDGLFSAGDVEIFDGSSLTTASIDATDVNKLVYLPEPDTTTAFDLTFTVNDGTTDSAESTLSYLLLLNLLMN